MVNVNLVYGTVYGSAQFTAETLAKEITALGFNATLMKPNELADFIPKESEHLIVVCSTTGQGEVTEDIYPWFAHLKTTAPYLPKLKYSIVGLGDSSYDTFCGAAKQFDALLSELGAQALTPRLEIDATETMEPELEATKWLTTWHAAVVNKV
ncbi:flavodoxin [Shewanella subflava]|uniref:Flavodoxin n=1 Tax=Shewanella subflava TaxID=2986476 RepID=A0ABT3IDL5_9GAMM|nr:flavodoxin [Shewanella subflava]MCW3174154.1 flavodoxin [Shewanella subflava]